MLFLQPYTGETTLNWNRIVSHISPIVSPVDNGRNNNKILQWFLRLWPRETPFLYVYNYSPVHSRRNHCIVLSVIYGKCLKLYIEVLANNIFRLRTDFTACQLGRQHRHYRHPWTPLLYKRTLFLSLDNLSYYLCLHFSWLVLQLSVRANATYFSFIN